MRNVKILDAYGIKINGTLQFTHGEAIISVSTRGDTHEICLFDKETKKRIYTDVINMSMGQALALAAQYYKSEI